MPEQNGMPDLTTAACGPLTLDAPAPEGELTIGEFGHLWQWTGPDETLISLLVTVRRNSHLTTPMSIRNRLTWELDQIVEQQEESGARVEPADNVAPVGDFGRLASIGSVDGRRLGVSTHERVLVTTDGTDLFSVHVIAADTAAGRAVADRIVTSVEL